MAFISAKAIRRGRVERVSWYPVWRHTLQGWASWRAERKALLLSPWYKLGLWIARLWRRVRGGAR